MARCTTRSRAWSDLTNRTRVVAIAVVSTALAAAIARLIHARSVIEAWSFGSAYVAFLLLAISLSLGPLNLLRRRHNPVHSTLRRDFGIASGIAAIVHTLLGLQVHMGGDLSRYFLPSAPPTSQNTAFVTANYVGLTSALVLALLVTISNNISIRRLGLPRWKKVQRTVYVAAIAAIVHGLLYQLLEKRMPVLIGFVIAVSLAVAVLQLNGRRAMSGSASRPQ